MIGKRIQYRHWTTRGNVMKYGLVVDKVLIEGTTSYLVQDSNGALIATHIKDINCIVEKEPKE